MNGLTELPANFGPYRVIRLLGEGGMGVVYEATGPAGESVALKVFAADSVKSRLLRERFEVEGRILAKLRHPRLVAVQACGVDAASGVPYYAMDIVRDGEGRSTTLRDASERGEVTEARAERWYADLCDVIGYCHRQGVVHRDIKLGNVLLDAEDHAVLADFGVSRIVKPELREELKVDTTFVTGETTGTRPVMGSYWYLAPEVRRGEAATEASDWYALGVLFFRLLTGMWYEPGTDALDLLAPYDPVWRRRLEILLAEEPEKRGVPPVGIASRAPVGHAPRASRGRWLLLAGVMSAVAGLGLVYGVKTLRPTRTESQSALTLSFDATNRFAFCLCPPGTNDCRSVPVAVTRSYWLGATPVTRRQWFAVRGEPLTAWEGGEEAPMTYVSREEVLDFCVRLNRRFAAEIPRGYEIRLPTLAEWRLAYAQGHTAPAVGSDTDALRRAASERGWFGQESGRDARLAGLRRYYENRKRPVPLVTNIWRDFPPRLVNPGTEDWVRAASQVPPVPVALKPANDLGLYDMLGNCAERVYDTCATNAYYWGRTEWGVTAWKLYDGLGQALTNPVVRIGSQPVMVGSYLAPDLAGDRAWSADFDRLPHLGFRLCLGPPLPSAPDQRKTVQNL